MVWLTDWLELSELFAKNAPIYSKAFATQQHAFLSTGIEFYNIFVQAWKEIKISSTGSYCKTCSYRKFFCKFFTCRLGQHWFQTLAFLCYFKLHWADTLWSGHHWKDLSFPPSGYLLNIMQWCDFTLICTIFTISPNSQKKDNLYKKSHHVNKVHDKLALKLKILCSYKYYVI